MTDLLLSDEVLEGVIGRVLAAESEMLAGNTARPTGGFESLTGVGQEVERYLRGMQVGRAALADAAKTAVLSLQGLMTEANALDASLTASMSAGFAVQGMKR